jgi:hypothetical protein
MYIAICNRLQQKSEKIPAPNQNELEGAAGLQSLKACSAQVADSFVSRHDFSLAAN